MTIRANKLYVIFLDANFCGKGKNYIAAPVANPRNRISTSWRKSFCLCIQEMNSDNSASLTPPFSGSSSYSGFVLPEKLETELFFDDCNDAC